MILVDTSVWVDNLRKPEAGLTTLELPVISLVA